MELDGCINFIDGDDGRRFCNLPLDPVPEVTYSCEHAEVVPGRTIWVSPVHDAFKEPPAIGMSVSQTVFEFHT